MSIPVVSVCPFSLELLLLLHELIFLLLPVEHCILRLTELLADIDDLADHLLGHRAYFVLKHLLALPLRLNLLLDTLNIIGHVLKQGSLVDQVFPYSDLLNLLVINLRIQGSLLLIKLAFFSHVLFKAGLVLAVDLFLELIQEWI